jgi:hypothetical protein
MERIRRFLAYRLAEYDRLLGNPWLCNDAIRVAAYELDNVEAPIFDVLMPTKELFYHALML